MDKKIIKWIIVGCVVLLALTAIMPITNTEGNIEIIKNEHLEGIDKEGMSNDGDLQPRWLPSEHVSIARIAAEKVGWIRGAGMVEGDVNKYLNILDDASDYPDDFDPSYFTSWCTWDESHECKHAYFVDPVDRILKSRADEMCQHYYNKAMTEFKNGNPEEAFEYLGYATHFLQDVGNPMHTALAPMRNIAYHTDYENYVDNNWDTDEKFYESAMEAEMSYGYTPQDSVRLLAYYSNDRVDQLMNAITFGDNTKKSQITKECIRETTKYTIGFYTWETYISVSDDAYTSGETFVNAGSGWVSVPLFNVDMTFQTWGY